MKKIGVALLGLGVVGGGTYQILTSKREQIMAEQGVDVQIKAVLERNLDRCAQLGVDMSIVKQDINDILNDDQIDIVAEFFGGVEPARTFLLKALESGKSIVTANKEMFSKSWHQLESVAQKTGAGIYFEASCVGGVPVIRAIEESMQANSITSLKGIVNGTTNYILTRMSEEGVDYQTCLEQAQALGYAEANPTADVDGFDAMYKNSILSSLCYKQRVPIQKIFRQGISSVNAYDIQVGKSLGYTLKLLAISKCKDDKIECRVHPAFVKNGSPLATVNGVFNALLIHGDNVDDVMLYGRGAGSLPTASAIVSDIVYCAKQSVHRRFDWECKDVDESIFVDDFSSKYYVRLCVDGDVISKVAKVFENALVKVQRISQNGDEIVLVTDVAKESVVMGVLDDVKALANIKDVCAVIRIED